MIDRDPNEHPVRTMRIGNRDIEYDPLTGVKTTLDYGEYEETGKVHVTRAQDIEKLLDYTKRRQNNPIPTQDETWNQYAIIPAIGQLEMIKAGIDMARDPKAVVQWINRYHPEWKVTNKWHDDVRAQRNQTQIIVK